MKQRGQKSQKRNLIKQQKDSKLLDLLTIVIDNYIARGEPIGSKYLHSLDKTKYAPSTLRKYLHALEKAGFVYQPYNSSGRIPTLDGIAVYLDTCMQDQIMDENDPIALEIDTARCNLRNIVDSISKVADGVVVGFIKNDEYYFLGINNLLRDATQVQQTMMTTREIIDFIETREIIGFLSTKITKNRQIYYTFVNENDLEHAFSCLYAKINVNDYDGIIAIVGPMRINYKKNLSILKKLVELVG